MTKLNLKEYIVRARINSEWQSWSLDETSLTGEFQGKVKELLKENKAFVLQQIVDYPDVVKYNRVPRFKLEKLGLV